MSCEATPAHTSESFEWRIRQRSRYGSRFSASELRHFKAKPRFCLNAIKRESSKKRAGAAENCFIFIYKKLSEAQPHCSKDYE